MANAGSRVCGSPGRLRVLAVIPGKGTGSSMISARRQNRSLLRAGIEVREFFLKSRTNAIGLFEAWVELRREIERFRPDIIHAHYGTVTGIVAALAWLGPVVQSFRGSDLNRHRDVGFIRYSIGFFLSQLAALRASTIICVSSELRRRLWWRKNHVVILPTGINLEIFRPISTQAARKLLGWSIDERIVLFSGGIHPEAKGLSFVFAAIGTAEDSVGRIRLVNLDGSTPPDEMPLYLNGADCLAFASDAEGSPNIVKEALACNLPVVTLDVGDVKHRVQGAKPGGVSPRDIHEFGRELVRVLRAGSRSNGRMMVSEISEERIAEEIGELYRSI